MRTWCSTAIALALAVSCSGRARAEERGFDARTVRPSLDPRAGTSIEPASVPEGTFTAGAFAGAFKNPVQTASKGVSTREQLGVGVGFRLGRRLFLSADLPFVIQEARALPTPVAGVTHGSGAGIGDLAVGAKIALWPNERGGFGLAALPRLTVPTGDPATFVSERGVSGQASLLLDYNLLLAGVQGSLGFKLRSARADLEPGVRYGNEIPFHAAIWVRPSLFKLDSGERHRWEIGLHGSLPAGPAVPFRSTALTPVVLRFGDRVLLGHHRDVTLAAGFEIGLTRAIANPTFGLFLGVVWGPRDHDRDHDGVEDARDVCPDVPAKQHDGCPVIVPPPDRDHDGIPDVDDACPDERGDPTDDLRCHGCAIGDRDHDGVDDHDDKCPDQPGVPPDGCKP